MELGGSDPMIVLQDADVAFTIGKLIMGRCCAATGQICISPKRVFVHESMYD
jgi:acyl-CoA reductase-like NAD-dependent aldehyde dehydrogenase